MIKPIIIIPILIILFPLAYANPCNDDLMFFDNGCYECDGILYKQENGNVVCVKCSSGFEYDLKGGCKSIEMPPETDVGSILDTISTRISPDNPLLGTIVIFSFIVIVSRYAYKRWFK